MGCNKPARPEGVRRPRTNELVRRRKSTARESKGSDSATLHLNQASHKQPNGAACPASTGCIFPKHAMCAALPPQACMDSLVPHAAVRVLQPHDKRVSVTQRGGQHAVSECASQRGQVSEPLGRRVPHLGGEMFGQWVVWKVQGGRSVGGVEVAKESFMRKGRTAATPSDVPSCAPITLLLPQGDKTAGPAPMPQTTI